MAQSANTLCNKVKGRPLLGVLRHEHGVQGVKHGARDIPVEVVGLQIKGVTVSKKF